MPGEFSNAPHVDLLTLVRSLYRHRLENCTLRYVEERVLGYEREDPLPSALVPEAYFGYLRLGSHEYLEAALEHNRLDVISLVHLHSRMLRRLEGSDVDMDADDWLALGRHRWRRGARADGWRALRNATAFARGDAAATAGLLLSRRLVRRGAIVGADRLLDWLETNARRVAAPRPSLGAGGRRGRPAADAGAGRRARAPAEAPRGQGRSPRGPADPAAYRFIALLAREKRVFRVSANRMPSLLLKCRGQSA